MSTETERLQKEIAVLRAQVEQMSKEVDQGYYFSPDTLQNWKAAASIPETGHAPETVRSIIRNSHLLDFNQQLNTSSYVNVLFEKEEEDVALMGLRVNLADQTVYPESFKMHDTVVNMIARLWNCPEPECMKDYGVYAGAGTVGSTEACLLAGLALKFRWRNWFAERHNMTQEEVRGVRPNLIISTCYQAAWEKLFKYLDIEPRLISPSASTFTIDPKDVRDAIDENTMGVVCILGNHYGGQYDPVLEVDRVVSEKNAAEGLQVAIHVDAASGGFVAPFQEEMPAWDFRLPNVVSISSSGHKFGASCCGTGWIIWRRRKDLSEHVAVSVTYLGGSADSYTLNFSRPASGVYVQYYKLLRHGMSGYRQVCTNMMANAQHLREGLRAMTFKGRPRFVFLDNGDEHCLPVVAANLNPECSFSYDDIDLQHVLSQHHWFVGGYRMGFKHPLSEELIPLFSDAKANQAMFRVVVKSNLTRGMVDHLLASFREAFAFLDLVDFSGVHGFETVQMRHMDQRRPGEAC